MTRIIVVPFRVKNLLLLGLLQYLTRVTELNHKNEGIYLLVKSVPVNLLFI